MDYYYVICLLILLLVHSNLMQQDFKFALNWLKWNGTILTISKFMQETETV